MPEQKEKSRVVLVCSLMCVPIDENHIIIALRSWNFSGLSCILGIY